MAEARKSGNYTGFCADLEAAWLTGNDKEVGKLRSLMPNEVD